MHAGWIPLRPSARSFSWLFLFLRSTQLAYKLAVHWMFHVTVQNWLLLRSLDEFCEYFTRKQTWAFQGGHSCHLEKVANGCASPRKDAVCGHWTCRFGCVLRSRLHDLGSQDCYFALMRKLLKMAEQEPKRRQVHATNSLDCEHKLFETMCQNFRPFTSCFWAASMLQLEVMMNLGPSNYPFNETYATLIPAILMGNSIVMKVPNTGGLAHFLTMEAVPFQIQKWISGFLSQFISRPDMLFVSLYIVEQQSIVK